MPLKKILFRPGVNRENTRYTTENGWYEGDKVRFRQGNPEVIGGWARISVNTFLGVCRSLWNWVLLDGRNIIGLGTNLKFYLENGGAYYDITPIRATSTINTNPFVATNGSAVITVTDTAHGAVTGDFVTFSGATSLGGNITATVLNAEYQITVLTANTYTFVATATANASDVSGSPGGGASVVATYQISVGPEVQQVLEGWGSGGWGLGTWGNGAPVATVFGALRIWSQQNFGEDLVFAPRGGGLYYWDASGGLSTRGVLVSSLMGADPEVPSVVNLVAVSDTSRFVFCFGCDDYGSSVLNPMLIRWSDQENILIWNPLPTNQAGSVTLSHGSEIIAVVQSRQEQIVFTDSAVYSLQYLGPPVVWQTQLLGDNTSIYGPNAAVLASGIVYWMGIDKFYKYDGRVQTLNCDLRRFIFNDINKNQNLQVFAGLNEGFNEVWWFYCSKNSTEIDRYVIYNYVENEGKGVWYYGTMGRTAWLDSGLRDYPIAATYQPNNTGNLVEHENGLNDNATDTEAALDAYISSSEFDIDDGHNFGFVWRILPDLTFGDSTNSPTAVTPRVTMSLLGLSNSGSGVTETASSLVTKGNTYVITEEFTGQIYTRIRGRQMIFKIASNQINTQWQLGAPRIDIRPDGRR
jgi:hypothetical protein